jgi:hypothetical protein
MSDSPSFDEYIDRSPKGIRAGLGAARRSAPQSAHSKRFRRPFP